MSRFDVWSRAQRGLVVVAAIAVTSACAHVKPDELESELDQIRAEMRESEERADDRMRSVEDRLEQRLNNLETSLTNLQAEFDEFHSTVERLESAIRFNSPVHFAFDDDTIREQDSEILDRFAEVVQGYYQNAIITVEGLTDPAGSPEYNQQLGERRAQAVVEYLSAAGIPSDRLRAVSYGEASDRQVVPGAQGPGEDGWQNRRVAMVIDFGSAPADPTVTMGSGAVQADDDS